jgi:methanogenic corrinoid protein MtbC1
MPSIDEFPDDPKYTIKAVSNLTGIRPVTLRAWERRHEVLNPHRAGNRYRLYSERDVAILRWLKNRTDNGVTISSAIQELRSMISRNTWPDALPEVPSRLTNPVDIIPPAQYATRLANALMKHDEPAATELVQETHAVFSLLTIFVEVFVPALIEIGEAWYEGRIRVTTEHFASAFLRGKLLSLFQAYPSRRNAPYILVGCAPTEQHELGCLMVAVLLRSRGYRVEYLGPDLPLDDLVEYAKQERPAMIVLSATTEQAALELRPLQGKFRNVRPAPVFAYGGRAFDLDPKITAATPGVYLGNTLEKAVNRIYEITERREKLG